jgi:hypothetical protein
MGLSSITPIPFPSKYLTYNHSISIPPFDIPLVSIWNCEVVFEETANLIIGNPNRYWSLQTLPWVTGKQPARPNQITEFWWNCVTSCTKRFPFSHLRLETYFYGHTNHIYRMSQLLCYNPSELFAQTQLPLDAIKLTKQIIYNYVYISWIVSYLTTLCHTTTIS